MLVQSETDIMYIGKGGALNRGLKLIKQLIRVLGCILERHIWQRVENDEMQCRFMSRHWWHYSCDLHFKPATEAAPDFKQAILHHIY